MDGLALFCNETRGNRTLWDWVWAGDGFTDCGQLAVVGLAHLLLLLGSLHQILLGRRLPPLPCQAAVATSRTLASLVTSAAYATLAVLAAYHERSKPLTAEWLVVGVVWFFHAGAWLPFRRRSAFLALLWLLAVGTLVLDVGNHWTLRASSTHIIATTATAIQIFYATSVAVELWQRCRVVRTIEVHQLAPEATLGSAEDGHNWVSKMVFLWTCPLMEKGKLGQLESLQSLFQLPSSLEVDRIAEKFTSARARLEGHPRVLLRSLLAAFGRQYFALGVLKFAANMLSFTGPILLHRLVSFVGDPGEPLHNGYLYALALFTGSLLSALAQLHFGFHMTRVGLMVRSALITSVYEKLLGISAADLNDSGFTHGELMNFMSTDTDRIVNFCPSFHDAWGLPLQLAIALFLLYQEVGLAFVAGVGFAVFLVPVNRWITVKIGELSTQMMLWKDRRVNMMTELLLGIRAVKLSAWEPKYSAKIDVLREQELKYLKVWPR